MVKRAVSEPRVREGTRQQRRAQAKKEATKRADPPGSYSLVRQSLDLLRQYWKIMGGIFLIYGVLDLIFASGLSNISGSFSDFKSGLNSAAEARQFGNALSGFGQLFGNVGAAKSDASIVLQVLLAIIISLVMIWTLRQVLADKVVTIRQAFYSSSGPFIQFLLVVGWLLIELLPLAIGATLFDAILSSSAGGGAALAFGVVFAGLALSSVYLVSGSLFALYVVTLPDMTPWSAISSAHDLVRFRRFQIIRRLLGLGLFMLLAMALIVVPLIIYAPAIVPASFFILSLLAIIFAHTYLYSFYRSLLR